MKKIIFKWTLLLLVPLSFSMAEARKRPQKPGFTIEEDTRMVKAILKKIDKDVTDTTVYADDLVHMAQGSKAITSKGELYKILKAEAASGQLEMTHEVVDLYSYPDLVLTRGRVKGAFHPADGSKASTFETNNMITFKRSKDGGLKIWQVIFNRISQETPKSLNPFHNFFGEWTLKDDNWSQNWRNGDEHIRIPNHYTLSKAINTDNSLLSVIDTEPKGHIFWSYNPVTKEVNHLSSFGTSRSGVGKGTINENGDVTLKISFEGELKGSYRIYTYKWVTQDEYELKSIQYNDKNEPTGFFYGGVFVRKK